METRIHETITVICSQCDAHNPTHWFWPSIECFRCGATLDVEQENPATEPEQGSQKLQVA
jgi:ribosomal protein L40E